MQVISYAVDETEPVQEGSIWYLKYGDKVAICVKAYGRYHTFFADGSGSVRDSAPPEKNWTNLPKGKKITLILES